MPSTLWLRRTCFLLVILLLIPFQNAGAIQSAIGLGGARGKKRSASPPVAPEVGEAPKPQLLNPDSDPTLRYPVSVWESVVTCGWLDVTRRGVTYTVVEGGGEVKPHPARQKYLAPGEPHYLVAPISRDALEALKGFDLSFSEIKDSRMLKGIFLQITSGKGTPLLTFLPQDQWGSVNKPRDFENAASMNIAGTVAILRAMQNFGTVLAEVRPPAPASLDVSLRADPPTVERGRPVTLIWNSTNATRLDLEPGVGRVAAAGGISLMPQDSTSYTLTATGAAGTKIASVYVAVTAPAPAAVPTLVLTEPSAAEGQTVEVSTSPLTINGVVMDVSGMPIVTVNGRSVTMRPTSAQAAQFRSDPIDLQPGDNRFEVTATNSAHGQAKVTFIAHLSSSPRKAQPAEPGNSKGLGKAEILSLLQGDVPSARVAELVKERGIKFAPTPDDLKDVRAAGGGDDLIDAINQAAAAARN